MSGPDPFATAELQDRVLAAWRASPARFRADANLEDDVALVGYRDRVVVELIQNAADAARAAGQPGRVRLSLVDDVLIVANTGTPVSAAGVESIAVARASAKRDDEGAAGRFGVGFAAVLSVSDEPVLASRSGAVRWSRQAAAELVAGVDELAEELAIRGDQLPVLRLPLATTAEVAAGFDTEVVLRLRDQAAIAAVARQLSDLDPSILLALPVLGEIAVCADGGERLLRSERDGALAVLHDGAHATRWAIAERVGLLTDELLATLPLEHRRDNHWSITCALPIDPAGRLVGLPATVPAVVRAPTPTDEALTLPALVVASYPLDATRRRVLEGPVTDELTAQVAATIAELLADLPADPSLLGVIPVGLPDGAIDVAIRSALIDRLREQSWLPVAGRPDIRQRSRDAIAVPDPLVGPLSDAMGGVLPAGWSGSALSVLGIRQPSIVELVDAVASVAQPAAWWRDLYAGFAAAVPAGPDRDALGALPVPLTDGRLVTGPRGVVVPSVAVPGDVRVEADLGVLGVRLVDPAADHPLLRALGASAADPRGLLDLPQVQQIVAASYDEDDPEPVAAAIMALVDACDVDAAELAWLAELALPDDQDDWRPAGELLLPGGVMDRLVATDSGFGRIAMSAVERWGPDVLRRVGVLDLPAVVRVVDATGPDNDLDDEAAWWAQLPDGAAVAELVAIRDLEQLREDALPELVDRLQASPSLRDAVVAPAVVLGPDGASRRVRSYSAWWLSSRPLFAGQPTRELRTAGADPALSGLYDAAPASLDDELAHALGVVSELADVDPHDLLARLADPARIVDRAALRAIYHRLAPVVDEVPDRVRAVQGGDVVVVDAEDAVIIDAPDLLALIGDRAVLPIALTDAPTLAAGLDVALASELADYPVRSTGTTDGDLVVHDRLITSDADGMERQVSWRLVDGVLHVDSGQIPYGAGRGRAWRNRDWVSRHRRTEAVTDPQRDALRTAEDDLDEY